jgi:aminopeptidase N
MADMAENDPKSLVRASAIQILGRYKKDTYKSLFLKSINDSSYAVAGNALVALAAIDTLEALKKARIISDQHTKGVLADAITNILFTYADENDFDFLSARFENLSSRNAIYRILQPFGNYMKRVKDTGKFMKGIDLIVQVRDNLPQQMRQQFGNYMNVTILKNIAAFKQSAGMTEQADYVKSKLPVDDK